MNDRDKLLEYIADRLDHLASHDTPYATGYCDALRRLQTLITAPSDDAVLESPKLGSIPLSSEQRERREARRAVRRAGLLPPAYTPTQEGEQA